MKPVTLRSPLGWSFRIFAFTMLLCAMTCFKAVGISWGKAGTYQYKRSDFLLADNERVGESLGSCPIYRGTEIIITSGRIEYKTFSSNVMRPPSAQRLRERTGTHVFMRIPEPLVYHEPILIAMFVPQRPGRVFMGSMSEYPHSTFIPLWPVALLTILPAVRYARHRYTQRIERRRRRKGCCIACGYDLRFSPHRCPECGLEISERTTANPIIHEASKPIASAA